MKCCPNIYKLGCFVMCYVLIRRYFRNEVAFKLNFKLKYISTICWRKQLCCKLLKNDMLKTTLFLKI